MSADNGIYIHEFSDGWRVCHAQAIDNIYWWNTESKNKNDWELRDEINPKILWDYFKDSPLFETKQDALEYAEILHNGIYLVEYGICII